MQQAFVTDRGSHIPPDLRVYLSPDAADQFLSRRGGHDGYRLFLAPTPLGEAGGRMYLTNRACLEPILLLKIDPCAPFIIIVIFNIFAMFTFDGHAKWTFPRGTWS